MSDEPRSPELDTLLALAGEAFRAELRVALPGRITNYDAAKQKARVKPLVKDLHVDANEARVAIGIPEVSDVPVLHVGPARGRITTPVANGDICLLIFASSSLTQWLLKGGEVDPKDPRHQDVNDAIAIVGLHSFASIPTEAPTDAVVIHCGNGIKAKIGGPTGTQPTLMANAFLSALDTLVTAISTAVGTIAGGAAAAADIITALEAFQSELVRNAYKTTKTEVK